MTIHKAITNTPERNIYALGPNVMTEMTMCSTSGWWQWRMQSVPGEGSTQGAKLDPEVRESVWRDRGTHCGRLNRLVWGGENNAGFLEVSYFCMLKNIHLLLLLGKEFYEMDVEFHEMLFRHQEILEEQTCYSYFK